MSNVNYLLFEFCIHIVYVVAVTNHHQHTTSQGYLFKTLCFRIFSESTLLFHTPMTIVISQAKQH